MKIAAVLYTEFAKARKNPSLVFYLIAYLAAFTVISFTAHLSRWGDTGNRLIPLNITYSGYIFHIGFGVAMLILCLLVDSDIREEIKTGKIHLLFTQSATRTDYLLGKTLFWLIISLCWLVITGALSWLYAGTVFSNHATPRLLNDAPVPLQLCLLNFVLQGILLVPIVWGIIIIAFITGFFVRLSSVSILMFLALAIAFLAFRSDLLLTPFVNMRIYDNTLNGFNFFQHSAIPYILSCIICGGLVAAVLAKNLNRQEF